jgi:hypothetical protein
MTLKSILRSAGLSLATALKCDNTLRSHIMVLSGQQLLRLFPANSVGKLPQQRNDAARLESSKGSHVLTLENRPDTQSEFHAVFFEGRLWILNGNHRIRAWWLHAHLIMESVCLRIYEPKTVEQMEALYNSIDSRRAAKGSQDDLWSIFNFAGFSEKLESTEMTTGKNLATVMKRFLPGTGIVARGQVALAKQEVLLCVDNLFLNLDKLAKNGPRKLSEAFGGGELLAIMELMQSYLDKGDKVAVYHIKQIVQAELLVYLNYAMGLARSCTALADVFAEYEQEAFLKGHKRTGEKVVVARAAILKPLLDAYVTSVMMKVPATRARRSTRAAA